MSFCHVLELCQNEQKGRDVFMFYDVYIELCHNNGKSPSAVAQELGINKSNVSNWKNNGYTPRGAVLNKIAEYFSVSVDYLLGKEQKETPAESGERTLTFDDFTYAMHEASKNLSERDKQILLGMAEQLKKSKDKE